MPIQSAKEIEPAGGRLLTIPELAELLNIPAGTIRNWRSRKEGPRGYKVGGAVRYRLADVELWLESRADPPTGYE